MNEFVLALLKCPGIGSSKALKYILNNDKDINKCLDNIDSIINRDEFNLLMEQVRYEIELNKKKNIDIITIFDNNFPDKLYMISDPVLYLYYYGNIDLLNKNSIAVIGTRKPNDKSLENTKLLVKSLVDNDIVIVAGLALGIDSEAHSSCVSNGGNTIAVLPTGIDNIQPTSNRDLAASIVDNNGLLVSEYSVGSVLNKFNYAKRDRIQAALSDVVIVPEASEESGTMIAVNAALKSNKHVLQFSDNNNTKIIESFDINDNYIDLLLDYIKQNKNKVFEVLNDNDIDGEQTSLF